MQPKSLNSATLLLNVFCSDCGWPVIDACCNDEMSILHPDSDYWWYCSNQGCKNHKGEEFSQNNCPDWTFRS